MSMQITFGEGDRVDAAWRGLTVATAQDGTHPSPFELFLASIGTCAGFYVSSFCRKRGIPTAGIRLDQRVVADPATGMIDRVEIDVRLPEGFPEQYREAAIRAAGACAVKKHLERPPGVEVRAVPAGSAPPDGPSRPA